MSIRRASGRSLSLALCAGLLGACAGTDLAREAPPLADMEEPLALRDEPDDEADRRELPTGAFSGLQVADARRTLAAMDSDAPGVRVVDVVENSPADFAGLREGDLLVYADTPDGSHDIRVPGDWRAIELEAAPGTVVELTYDRAARERVARIELEQRLRPADRAEARRYREDRKVGVVVRAATEVEARSAGLPPGGGAVVVGLSAASPWRTAGIVFEDLIVAVDGEPLNDPSVLIQAIEADDADDGVELELLRGGERVALTAPVSERASAVTNVSIPFVYSHSVERGESETSVLMGLIRKRSTEVAWEWRLLWLFSFSGGEQDRLVEETQ